MSKIKLTKSEMKRKRDSLKQFKRYLPTLQLKKQQLQMKIAEVQNNLDDCHRLLDSKEHQIEKWVGLLADPSADLGFEKSEQSASDLVWGQNRPEIDLRSFIQPTQILTKTTNIAGAKVPVYEDALFNAIEYDFYAAPYWLDMGIDQLRDYIRVMIEASIIEKQLEILNHELRITTQRVNLFEKVKIPECKENIRKISIYLGDQQANAVGVSKVAKKKVEARNLEVSVT